MKRVRIRSYSGLYFPTFGLNTERYSLSLRFQSECGKIRIRITPNMDIFYAVQLVLVRVNLERIRTKDIAFTWHSQWTILNLNICFRLSLRFHLPVVGLFIYFKRLSKPSVTSFQINMIMNARTIRVLYYAG